MINCPCGFGKNIKKDQKNCHICGTDLTPLHHLMALPNFYYSEGIKMAEQGKPDIAIEKLMTAISLNFNSAAPYIILGDIYTQKGLYNEAITNYQKALAIDSIHEENKKIEEKIESSKAKFKKSKCNEMSKVAFYKKPIITHALAFFIGIILISLIKGIVIPQRRIRPKYSALAGKIKQRFSNYPAINDLNVEVTHTDKALSVSGEVPTDLHINLITEIVMNIADNIPVNMRNLVLTIPKKPETDYYALAEEIKLKILNYPVLADLNVKIAHTNEILSVSGEVPTDLHKNLIAEIVMNIVDNIPVNMRNLSIALTIPKEKKPETDYYALSEEIKLKILNYPELAALNVKIAHTDGILSVSGEVPTDLHKNLITEIVMNIAQTIPVIMQNLVITPTIPDKVKPQIFLYTVKLGDSLMLLASRFYGNGQMWTKIYQANKEKIIDPRKIFEGQVLSIPFQINGINDQN